MRRILVGALVSILITLGSQCDAQTGSRSAPKLTEDKHLCHSISFETTLTANNRFDREIGRDIWISAYPGKGRWTLRIGNGRERSGRYDVGWSLAFSWNEDWELGAVHGGTAEAAMKASPRRLWFVLSEKDYNRLRAAQASELSSKWEEASCCERSPAVLAAISKGLADVTISDYQVGETGVMAVTLRVNVVTPVEFPLTDSSETDCPTYDMNRP